MNIHHTGYLVKDMEESMGLFLKLGYTEEAEKKYDPVRKIYIAFLKNGDSS